MQNYFKYYWYGKRNRQENGIGWQVVVYLMYVYYGQVKTTITQVKKKMCHKLIF